MVHKCRSAQETPSFSSPCQVGDRRDRTSGLPNFRASAPVDFRLYLITDRSLFPAADLLLTAVEDALKGGVKAVQLREKDLETGALLKMARLLRDLTEKYNARLFINDRVDIALVVRADGVHLSRESIPAHAARKIAGNKFMIGVSTHSISEACEAEKEGADFITLGPVFRTPSKMRYGEPVGVNTLKEVKAKVSIPVFAIGGINVDVAKKVREAGADGVALISAILNAENVGETTEKFVRSLK